jgi:hypothetical protein
MITKRQNANSEPRWEGKSFLSFIKVQNFDKAQKDWNPDSYRGRELCLQEHLIFLLQKLIIGLIFLTLLRKKKKCQLQKIFIFTF